MVYKVLFVVILILQCHVVPLHRDGDTINLNKYWPTSKLPKIPDLL